MVAPLKQPLRLSDLSIPNHESYVIQQKVSGSKSIYGSDTNVPKALRKYEPNCNVLKQIQARDNAAATNSIPFCGETTQASAGAEVAVDKVERKFFSELLKKQIKAANEQSNAFLNARQEGELNANKGHGGAAGLSCLRQSKAVSERIPDVEIAPRPSQFTTQRAKSAPFKRGDMLLKLSDASATWKTSYDLEFGLHNKRMTNDPMLNVELCKRVNVTEGTTKSIPRHRNVGYMGHIPSNESNLQHIIDGPDPQRFHMKDNLIITAHIDVPGYKGYKPISVFNDKGTRAEYDLNATTAGSAGKQVADDILIGPMNTRDHAVSHSMKNFFSRGHTGEDLVVAETYYTRFRPYEGLMKMGKD